MLEKWKRGISKGEWISASFADLSMAFYTVNHVILAKLNVYGFSTNTLSLTLSYLKNKKQKVRINNKFSLKKDIIAGVESECTEVPLLFNLLKIC